jgi:hypothetical protein
MTGVVVNGCAWARATRQVARGPSPRWLTPLAWRCCAIDLVRPKVHPTPFLRGGQESPNRLKPRVAGLTVTETPEPASWRIWSRIAAVGEPKILIAAFAQSTYS